jgi:formate/nitrite transporter FocA (FNT family)
MIQSILAGFLISMGGIIYLESPDKIVGALLFSIGLFTILHFKWNLFTGKAGLLAKKQIKWWELGLVWVGNAIGCAFCGLMIRLAKPGFADAEPIAAILNTRCTNTIYINFILGIFCGMLMYIAVESYKTTPFLTILYVATFILSGFNHCVADMFFFAAGASLETILPMTIAVVATTIGNLLGCNLIPLLDRRQSS